MNENYPEASGFVRWALKRAIEKVDSTPVRYNEKLFQVTKRQWSGNTGTNAEAIYQEIGNSRVYLTDDEFRQVWIERAAPYGSVRVGEAIFSIATCGRCNEEPDDEDSAKINVCEDCITAVTEDPEGELEAWCRGDWG